MTHPADRALAEPGASGEEAPAADGLASAELDALLAALERLERAIEQETLALADQRTEPLLDAVDHKRRALAEVERLIRTPALAWLGAPDRKDGSLPSSSPQWSALLERLEACRASNEAVGGALAAARRSTDASLKWLGLAAEADTYDDRRGGSGPRGRDLAVC